MADYATPSPDATPSPAETLRRAAALMRGRAEAAFPHEAPTEWADNVTLALYHGGSGPEAEAEHIASWHPAVALAVADWMDRSADWETPKPVKASAFAVARAYLGES